MSKAYEDFFQQINYVTLKLTPGCNLKCTYCNVEAITPKTPKMGIERFRQIADLLVVNSKSPFVGLEFHGGEPMLLPDEWYEEAVGYARKLANDNNKIIEFPLVTNGTMLSEKRLEKLLSLGIRICLSCDGPPHINDELRGGGERVERTFKMLRDKRVPFSVITVVGTHNWNRIKEVMDWFGEVGVYDYTINFVQPQGRGMDAELLSGEQMFTTMRDIFEHMESTDIDVHEAEVIGRVQKFVRGRDNPPRPACHEFHCQAGKNYVAIDMFGSVHACGTDLAHHKIGHVDLPFNRKHYDNVLEKLHDKGDWVLRCFDCDAAKICNHSCPTSDANSDMFKEYDCLSTKLLWQYFCENPTRVQKLHERLLRKRYEMARQAPAAE